MLDVDVYQIIEIGKMSIKEITTVICQSYKDRKIKLEQSVDVVLRVLVVSDQKIESIKINDTPINFSIYRNYYILDTSSLPCDTLINLIGGDESNDFYIFGLCTTKPLPKEVPISFQPAVQTESSSTVRKLGSVTFNRLFYTCKKLEIIPLGDHGSFKADEHKTVNAKIAFDIAGNQIINSDDDLFTIHRLVRGLPLLSDNDQLHYDICFQDPNILINGDTIKTYAKFDPMSPWTITVTSDDPRVVGYKLIVYTSDLEDKFMKEGSISNLCLKF